MPFSSFMIKELRLTAYRNDKNPRSLWKVLVSRRVMFISLYYNPLPTSQRLPPPAHLPPHAVSPGQGWKPFHPQEARPCVTLPHLFPSPSFLLGLEAGNLSPGVDGPPKGTGLVRELLVVVAGPPPRWLSPEFSLL